jgi:hypothetical protein
VAILNTQIKQFHNALAEARKCGAIAQYKSEWENSGSDWERTIISTPVIATELRLTDLTRQVAFGHFNISSAMPYEDLARVADRYYKLFARYFHNSNLVFLNIPAWSWGDRNWLGVLPIHHELITKEKPSAKPTKDVKYRTLSLITYTHSVRMEGLIGLENIKYLGTGLIIDFSFQRSLVQWSMRAFDIDEVCGPLQTSIRYSDPADPNTGTLPGDVAEIAGLLLEFWRTADEYELDVSGKGKETDSKIQKTFR